MSETLIHRYVAEAEDGSLPRAIAKMASGWLCLGDPQVQEGYCVLYPDPVVPHLNALEEGARAQFLSDMALAGDVVLEVTNAVRINYEILGNQEPALHAHIIPRFDDEDPSLRSKPIWSYDWGKAPSFGMERHAELRIAIADALRRHLKTDEPG
ncbi:MAG: hypothetical protein KF812_13330 [Fimbriimonadaceae bacterium]|nr:hypothetical protein [Fimbriimonadaceae bacterium]